LPDGGSIPCSAESVAFEIMADSELSVDPDLVRQAAVAVLQYFRNDVQRTEVTPSEFAAALAQALARLGLQVAGVDLPPAMRVQVADLDEIARRSEASCELDFYRRLKLEIQVRLSTGPRVLRFRSLRATAKRLVGARRWCPRSQTASDQIVAYLRECFGREPRAAQAECLLLVD
jgi:hypothetical protein